jgi:hypothetical protein
VAGHARDHIQALDHLFLGYFHPDWHLDHDDGDAVLRYFCGVEPETAVQAALEIDYLLADEAMSDDLLESLFLKDAQFRGPKDGLGMRRWLTHARTIFISPYG